MGQWWAMDQRLAECGGNFSNAVLLMFGEDVLTPHYRKDRVVSAIYFLVSHASISKIRQLGENWGGEMEI